MMPSKEKKHWEDNNGHIQCINDGRRTGSVSVRYAGDGRRAGEGIRRKAGADSGKSDIQSDQGGTARSRCDGGDSVVISDDRYGCRICQFGYYEAEPGSGNYHGCQYRYNRNFLDPQFIRVAGRQYLCKIM